MMVGLTPYSFKPGDDCYIVVFTPYPSRQEYLEFLEGKVREISMHSATIPFDHPLLRYLQTPPKMIREIQAEVTDQHAAYRHPTDPIVLNEIPGRHYLVVPPQECVRYLKQVLGETQHALQRQKKMNQVQLYRIRDLEAVVSGDRRFK